MSLQAVDYSDRSIAVYGDTKNYKAELQSLGGKFNSNLQGQPGWVFSKRSTDAVVNFVDQVNAGTYVAAPEIIQIRPTQLPAASPRTIALPSVSLSSRAPLPVKSPRTAAIPLQSMSRIPTMAPRVMPIPTSLPKVQPRPTIVPQQRIESTMDYPNRFIGGDGLQYQVIIYTVPLPIIGQTVNVTMGEEILTFTIVSINSGSHIDSIFLNDGESEVNIEACLISGKWKLLGETREHMITFV